MHITAMVASAEARRRPTEPSSNQACVSIPQTCISRIKATTPIIDETALYTSM